MANSDYVGRYGDTLRRLTALEMGGLQSPPSGPQGPQPVTGAFSVVPEQMRPQRAPAGAFSAAPPPAPTAEDATPPLSARGLYDEMPDEVKDKLEKQIADSGINIESEYDRLVEKGEIPPVKEKALTNKQKLGYIAEVALRTLSNLSRPGTESVSDWADAVLTTDARRGAFQTAESERARARAEQARREGREDSKELRGYDREDKKTREIREREDAAERRRRADAVAQGDVSHERAVELARIQAEALAGRKDPRIVYGQDGGVFTLDGNDANPVMTTETILEEVPSDPATPKKKSRSRPKNEAKFIEREVKKQLKTMPRPDASGIDRDTLLNRINDRVKILNEDRQVRRELRAKGLEGEALTKEIARMATDQVMAEYSQSAGGATQRLGGSTNPFDQFD